MKPILLIHGYSSEGKDTTATEIYGNLPQLLRDTYGDASVVELNLSRWISLNDGITLDDVSYAMQRALTSSKNKHLLETGFHVIIHSTGALVVRNWIRLFSAKPSPIGNFIHLAGANFGSGLAHIGQGQLARWGRHLFSGTGRGVKVLNELEFGSWKTIDMHLNFLTQGQNMYGDFEIQEFCLIGSQTLKSLRSVPIRYVKEDSSDNTVRTSAGNLNFNYVRILPTDKARNLTVRKLKEEVENRLDDKAVDHQLYEYDLSELAAKRMTIPYTILYETAHFGKDIGIVAGEKNRKRVFPMIKKALDTPFNSVAYAKTADAFEKERQKTFDKAAKLKWGFFEWNKQAQYEGHAQVIFRLKDQFGAGIKDHDITINTPTRNKKAVRLERMIEDHHGNKQNEGTITFYFRTQKFDDNSNTWVELLDQIAPADIEITAQETRSDDIEYVPLRIRLNSSQLKQIVQSFRTTVIDVTMQRLPSANVFKIEK